VKVTRVKCGLSSTTRTTLARKGRYPGRESGSTAVAVSEVSIA
jgi:hypothetical protein